MQNTQSDEQNIKAKISEIFGPTIQGEGPYAGELSIFVRFAGCNLKCKFGDLSVCDSLYAVNGDGAREMTVAQIADEVQRLYTTAYPNTTPHQDTPPIQVVFTGGEPMLQRAALHALPKAICTRLPGKITRTAVETNGTMVMRDTDKYIDCFAVSPKLSGIASLAILDDYIEAARSFSVDGDSVWLKFVISPSNLSSTIETIKKYEKHINEYLEKRYYEECLDDDDRPSDHYTTVCPIYLMPAGKNNEELAESTLVAATTAINNGWRYTDRLQIRIWGDKRGV